MIVDAENQLRSPGSVGITMLLLTAAACVPAAVIGAAEWLMRVPRLLVAVSTLVIFFAVLVTGIILAFRRAGTPTERAVLTPITGVVGRKPVNGRSVNGSSARGSSVNGRANGKPTKGASRRTRA